MNKVSALVDFVSPHGDLQGQGMRRVFQSPRQVLRADSLSDVRPVIDAAHEAACAGAWCVGYVRYEAAPAFDRAYTVYAAHETSPHHEKSAVEPFAWFAVFDEAQPWDGANVPNAEGRYATSPWKMALERPQFEQDMARIAQAIHDGENYQINYTTRLRSEFSGDAQAFFQALRRSQPQCYAAYIDAGDEKVLSVSPELFFEWRDGRLLSRPMKGTTPRGETPEADARWCDHLTTSEKERAENLMIVDLIRNDLSRVALPHTVKVPKLFATQAWPTFWGMTSDVTAQSRPGTRLSDVFEALFPCGSVIGVPKVRAMQLIREVEPSPRGVYCGAVGVMEPGGATTFNVAIRTVVIDGENHAQCGVGSGVTSDARPDGEWKEWQAKSAFLRRASEPFEILETVLLRDGDLPYADAHLARMAGAARWFNYPWSDALRTHGKALLAEQVRLHPEGDWRVRLLLDAQGNLLAQSVAQPSMNTPVRVQLADQPLMDAQSEFVRFKTTRRSHYEVFAPSQPGVFDTLLWNEAGEITEFTRGNVAVRLDGQWLTPPLSCGLLAGVGRAQLLANGIPADGGADAGQPVREAVIRREDIARAQALAFVNGCRGWLPAVLVNPEG